MNQTTVVRIQRKGGVVVQDCDVYIGRAVTQGGWCLPHSKWYNPYSVRTYGTAEEVVRRYEAYLLRNTILFASIGELKGKVLGCWCRTDASKTCHGDVLARYANAMD